METTDQEIMAAQERLLKKREELGLTSNPTQSMQSIEIEPGFFSHTTPICEEEDLPLCKHGYVIKGSYWCPFCQEEKFEEEERKRNTEYLEGIKSDPSKKLKKFGIPEKYIKSSFETFTGNDKLINECRDYQEGGLVLYGNTGCGKTHLAVSLMRKRVQVKIGELLAREKGYYFDDKMAFVTVPDLLLEIRSSFKDGAKNSEESIIEHYSEVDFLVLDDLGSEKASEFAITTLYIIIDRRDRDMKSTVITTNLSPIEIENQLSARIASRMSGMKNIKINMPDYRKKRP